ncbi:hypothetical protein RGL55_003853 [Vibrio parahaemolyticus]|nr:hypothetical protein [Vibrio parahaemolyticus]ELA8146768.1 hypothetical protein [Vibrio parahaemolyticus]ELA8181767.1 hypothetical protein [Vibrio parahaemolyticus]ELB2730186.1 hypothetical protein [Vibrio parahaemolyticus]
MCSLFIDLNHHHYILNIDLKKLASQQKSIQMKMKLLALAHFKDGYSRTQIAQVSQDKPNQCQ